MSGVARGSCLCGAVQFQVTFPSRFMAHCHCDNCRRAHGAAFVTWMGFPADRVEIVAGDTLRTYDTDTQAQRRFCATCGSTLFYSGPRWPGEIHVAASNLDDPPDRMPSAHVYVDHGAAWFRITDDLPQYGGATGTEPKG